MNENERKIKEWQEKTEALFKDKSQLHSYLVETLKNFAYRYLETSKNQNLTLNQISENRFEFTSEEPNLREALKISNREFKDKMIEFAKNNKDGSIKYRLETLIESLKPEQGKMTFILEVKLGDDVLRKSEIFEYTDLVMYRKNLALKLEKLLAYLL